MAEIAAVLVDESLAMLHASWELGRPDRPARAEAALRGRNPWLHGPFGYQPMEKKIL